MKVFNSILIVGSLLSIAVPSTAYAMLCRTCTDGQCKYLADKYSGGHYKMKSDGCHYIVAPDDERKAKKESLMKNSPNVPEIQRKSRKLSIGEPAKVGTPTK